MSERLHPDGLPVSATPYTDSLRMAGIHVGECQDLVERRAREAETRVAELEATLMETNKLLSQYAFELGKLQGIASVKGWKP